MASLGSFGVKRERDADTTFEFFGQTLRINPDFGELDVADFLEAAESVDEDSIKEASQFLKGTFRGCIHEDDFEQFWRIAKRERQTIEDLLAIFYAVMGMVTNRPTERPSDSSDGPTPTKPSSPDDSSLRVIRRLEEQGRPSIALMVAQRAEASAASA